MSDPIKYRLSFKLLLYILGCSIILALLATAVQLHNEYGIEMDEVHRTRQLIEKSYVEAIAISLYNFNEDLLQIQLEGLLILPHVKYVQVSSAGQADSFKVTLGEKFNRRVLVWEFDLTIATKTKPAFHFGNLEVRIDLNSLYGHLFRRLFVILLTLATKIIVAGLFFYLIIYYLITHHLEVIAKNLGNPDLTEGYNPIQLSRKRFHAKNHDELDLVLNAINGLLLRVNKEKQEREDAIEALRESEYNYSQVLQNANESILVIERQQISYSNPKTEELTGYSNDIILNQPVTIAYQLCDGCNWDIILNSVRDQDGNPIQDIYERRFQTQKGEIKWIEIKSVGIVWKGEEAALCFISEITKRKKAQEELQASLNEMEAQVEKRTIQLSNTNEALKREIAEHRQTEEKLRYTTQVAESANQAKSEFLANISHELRNPMHHILSYSKYGVEKLDFTEKSKLKHYFSQIRASAERLMRLLNNLLDLSKLEAQKMDFSFDASDVKTIVTEVTKEFEPLLNEKEISVNIIEPDLDLETTVKCDSFRLGQVFRNLLSNAVKFSPQQSNIKINFQNLLGPKREESQLIVSVSDQGMGIPPKEKTVIFDKFVQSSKTDKGQGGTGLGLAICKEIIKHHHGKIWAENNQQGGATFFLQLPIKISA
ncbi:PAS domain S-box protein [bacterium]|nr:PAS domain S-box protein [bacterium]